MSPENPLQSSFGSSLLDASNQPNMVKGNSANNELTWTLENNQSAELVVTPFPSGKVDENQYHFQFEFDPPVLTKTPTLDGWDVYAVKDSDFRITDLYVALSGSSPLKLAPTKSNKTVLTYSGAKPKDPSASKVTVSVTTGTTGVTVGGVNQANKTINFDLALVEVNTPSLSVPPLAVDYVGRRTVLNDGLSDNSFTFAITNMTGADLTLTKDIAFTVWFEAGPNKDDKTKRPYPWAALARLQDLSSTAFKLQPYPPSDNWSVTPTLAEAGPTPSNPRWTFRVKNNFVLQQQAPIFFTFSVLNTDLDPGMALMYLKFTGLPGFSPGVLCTVLEKTPLLYGLTRGQGLYLSAGNPTSKPAQNYDSGLYVDTFGTRPAASFNGGNVGIGTAAAKPAAKLHLIDTDQSTDAGSLILESKSGPTLRFGCQPKYTWIQSHAGMPLAINPTVRNVGIGTSAPGSTLTVAGGVAIGKGYAEKTTVGDNNLAVQGRIGINITNPGSALSVVGGVAIGKDYVQGTTVRDNYLAVQGNVGIGTANPESKLSVAGGVAIGKTYIALPAVPDNNLVVEGKVGVGTKSPSALLQVGATAHPDKEFADITTVGIIQRPKDTVGLSIRRVNDHPVLQFCTYDDNGGATCNYIQMDKSTADILIGSKARFRADGRVDIDGGLTISGKNALEFGASVTKEVSAGKIGYQVFSKSLDIVGAGETAGTRQIRLFDDIFVPGNIWQFMRYNKTWMALWPSGSSTGAWYNFGPQSDLRLKDDVKPVPNALEKIRRLNGVSFHWNDDALERFTRDVDTSISAGPEANEQQHREKRQAERDKRLSDLAASQMGVIAQEVEAVLPGLVTTDDDGYKSVKYHQLIALLIEAVKEQDVAITAQAKLAARQQAEIEQLKELIYARSGSGKDRVFTQGAGSGPASHA